MLKDITASGRYITVTGGSSSTYINGYSGSQGVGNMRYNTSSQQMEVFDGNNWVQLNMGYASVGLSGEAESLLDWARKKREEELVIQALADKHPAVKAALEAVERAQEQLKLIRDLSIEHEPN
jgi:hypothetical protein